MAAATNPLAGTRPLQLRQSLDRSQPLLAAHLRSELFVSFSTLLKTKRQKGVDMKGILVDAKGERHRRPSERSGSNNSSGQ